MKPYIPAITVICFGIVLFSCKGHKLTERTQNKQMITVDKGDPASEMLSALSFEIDTAWVSGQLLYVDVLYRGDKGQVDFNMTWNGAWLKSYPPKATVVIKAIPTSTEGKRMVKHHLCFDLEALTKSNQVFYLTLKDYPLNFKIESE